MSIHAQRMRRNLPWLNRGEYVLLEPDPRGDPKMSFWYLRKEEGIPTMVYAFDSVALDAESGWKRMGSDELDLETDKEDLLFQYFVGVKRKGNVYCQYPSGEEIWTTDKNVPTTSSGQRKACINSMDSPFEDPSALTQFIMIKGLTIAFDYYNTAEHALIQELKFIGKKFQRLECKLGTQADWLGRPLTANDMEKIKETAIPLQLRRIA